MRTQGCHRSAERGYFPEGPYVQLAKHHKVEPIQSVGTGVGVALCVALISATNQPEAILAVVAASVVLGFLVGHWWIVLAGLAPLGALVWELGDQLQETPTREALGLTVVGYVPIATLCIAAGVLGRMYFPRFAAGKKR